jgi:hypothetical protein
MMNEAQLYELLGRKQALLETLVTEKTWLVQVLRELKSGTLDKARLTVTDDGQCSLAPPLNGRMANLDIMK